MWSLTVMNTEIHHMTLKPPTLEYSALHFAGFGFTSRVFSCTVTTTAVFCTHLKKLPLSPGHSIK